ncbi:helix-turn-helix domain-containing protein, partial [Acidithiobacillus thiooxidans]|uniref:helix-turn-helix domain-containing protein n=1 Tax=Acidithiobacillus thiooxidans TaxID=930 RepID=UPI001C072FE4
MAAQITPRKRTLDLQEAADFLKISKEALRRKVCKGLIRGAKPGKRWAFLEDDLVDYFQGGSKNSPLPVKYREPIGRESNHG